jgi:hypothetical protein
LHPKWLTKQDLISRMLLKGYEVREGRQKLSELEAKSFQSSSSNKRVMRGVHGGESGDGGRGWLALREKDRRDS